MAQYKVTHPYAATIKAEPEGAEATYGELLKLGEMIEIDVSPNFNEGSLYGDNALCEYVKEFKDIDVTLNTTTMPVKAYEILFGQKVTGDGEHIAANINDVSNYVGFGFVKGEMVKNVTTYFAVWLPKVKFTLPSEKCTTKGESITWGTPSITGKGTCDGTGDWKKTDRFATEAEAIAFIKGKVAEAQSAQAKKAVEK